MCLGHGLLRLPQAGNMHVQSPDSSAGETIVNILLSAYVLIIEQAGLVVGTYRWGHLRQSTVRK